MYVIFARRLFKHRKRAVVLIIKIGSLFVVYILLRIFFFDIYRISGHSMEPALSDGDYVLVSKTAWGPRLPRSLYEIPYVNYLTHLYPLNLLDHNLTQQYRRLHSNNTIEKGDIVVFNLPVYQRQYGVKRCTLIPGDTIMAYRSAKASILPKKNDYIDLRRDSLSVVERRIVSHYKLQPIDSALYFRHGYYFLEGDNRDNSTDSRMWGALQDDHIVGKVSLIIFTKDLNKLSFFIPLKRCE